ncbi:reverse transcriptase domain-containing protein [Tanacetum coccineum]
MRSHQNESLAIAGRNLFNDEASFSNNTRTKLPTPPKTLHEHSCPNSSGFQNTITFPTEQTRRIVDSRDIWLIQSTCTFQGSKNKDPLLHVKHYLSIIDNIQADEATRDTSRLNQGDDEPIKSAWIRFQDLIKQVPHHGIQKWLLVQIFHDNISRIDRKKLDQFTQFRFSSLTEEEGWNRIEEYVHYQYDLWDEPSPSMNVSSILEEMQPTLKGCLKRACKQISFLKTTTREVCLSRGDIYNDPSLIRFYQNDDTLPWGNNKRKEKGEDGPKWIVRTINKSETPKPEAPTFAITTRSRISTQDPPFLALPRPATDNLTEGETEKEGLKGAEPSITQEPVPRPSILYQPSKTSNLPFSSRLEKQKQDDEDERLLLIFKQINFNLPFLEAMIHMPKGAKVLKESGLLMVISSALSTDKKTRLLEVLRNRKRVIAWSITDIKGIDSSLFTHKLLMEDKFKPSVQPQRRVDPNIKEVVPKKGGMTVVKNEMDELIPQRTVTGWCICIDYRKLTNATKKDHFPHPFIDQMLEQLAGHEYYCFLDRFSGYIQIPIALEEEEKTTFTCPYRTFTYKGMPFGLCNAPATFQHCMAAIFMSLSRIA